MEVAKLTDDITKKKLTGFALGPVGSIQVELLYVRIHQIRGFHHWIKSDHIELP